MQSCYDISLRDGGIAPGRLVGFRDVAVPAAEKGIGIVEAICAARLLIEMIGLSGIFHVGPAAYQRMRRSAMVKTVEHNQRGHSVWL